MPAQRRQLEDAGWEVLTVWECELKDGSALEAQLVRFLDAAAAACANLHRHSVAAGRRRNVESILTPLPRCPN